MLASGEILNKRFIINRALGEGSYGRVYLAGDLQVRDAEWAVKETLEGEMDEEERESAIDLFEREASLLSRLNHTGIPKVVDHFSQGAAHYLVMEFIEGETLEARMKNGRPCEKEVLEWALKICDILEYLHNLNPPLIFRDLKPSNIMLTARGRVILIDFGIARFFNPRKVKDTHILGTPGFAPPEQYGLGQSDRRSDIYSLGATIYHLLCGKDLADFNFRIPPLSQFAPGSSRELERIAGRCLQSDPPSRYQDIASLKEDLMAIRDTVRGKHSPPLATTASSRQTQAQAATPLVKKQAQVRAMPSHTTSSAASTASQWQPATTPLGNVPEVVQLWAGTILSFLFGMAGWVFSPSSPGCFAIACLIAFGLLFFSIPVVSVCTLVEYSTKKVPFRVLVSGISLAAWLFVLFIIIAFSQFSTH